MTRPEKNTEPGAHQDHMAHFGVGPGVTPLDDLTSGVMCSGLLIFLIIMMGKGLTEVPAGNLAWFLIILGVCQLMLIAGVAYFTQRGVRRWRWRIANVDKTGGVYLRMWQKTPHPEQ